jgi:hypothetical protein
LLLNVHILSHASLEEALIAQALRIKHAPPVLIVQLLRFTWDGIAGAKKLLRPVSFPRALDLSPHLADAPPRKMYELHGVIVHTGSARSGHYRSIVRDYYGMSDFLLFDDGEVSPIGWSDAVRESFSDVRADERTSCATILVYIDPDYSAGRWPLTSHEWLARHVRDRISETVTLNSPENNATLLLHPLICRVGIQIFEFDTFRDFYFKIFCHSDLRGRASCFTERFRDFFEMAEVSEDFMKWTIGHYKEEIAPVYVNASEISDSLTDVILAVCRHVSPSLSIQLLNQVVADLTSLLPGITQVARLIEQYLVIPETLSLARSWRGIFRSFLRQSLRREERRLFQNINIRLAGIDDSESSLSALHLTGWYESQRHAPSVPTLTASIFESRPVDLESLAQLIDMIEVCGLSCEEAQSAFRNLRCIVEWINCVDDSALSSCASTLLSALIDVDGPAVLPEMTRVLESMTVSLPFLELFLNLLVKIGHDRSHPPPGLAVQPPSDAKFVLEAYFGTVDLANDPFLELFEADSLNSETLRRRLSLFCDLLLHCCDSVLSHFVHRNGFHGLIDVIVHRGLLKEGKQLLQALLARSDRVPKELMTNLALGDRSVRYVQTVWDEILQSAFAHEDLDDLQVIIANLIMADVDAVPLMNVVVRLLVQCGRTRVRLTQDHLIKLAKLFPRPDTNAAKLNDVITYVSWSITPSDVVFENMISWCECNRPREAIFPIMLSDIVLTKRTGVHPLVRVYRSFMALSPAPSQAQVRWFLDRLKARLEDVNSRFCFELGMAIFRESLPRTNVSFWTSPLASRELAFIQELLLKGTLMAKMDLALYTADEKDAQLERLLWLLSSLWPEVDEREWQRGMGSPEFIANVRARILAIRPASTR